MRITTIGWFISLKKDFYKTGFDIFNPVKMNELINVLISAKVMPKILRYKLSG